MTSVEVEVLVSHLVLGGREGHEEEKTYRKGERITLPRSLAEALESSVKIIETPKPAPEPVVETVAETTSDEGYKDEGYKPEPYKAPKEKTPKKPRGK